MIKLKIASKNRLNVHYKNINFLLIYQLIKSGQVIRKGESTIFDKYNWWIINKSYVLLIFADVAFLYLHK